MLRSGLLSFLVAYLPVVASAGTPVTVFQNGQDGYKIFRIPAVIRAANGDLLAFCEAREGGDASEIDLVLKRSSNGGATWSGLQVVQESDTFKSLYGNNPPPVTVGNPVPIIDYLDPEHPGRLWLMFTVENDRIFVTHSDDHGKTWSERNEISSTVKKEAWGWYATGPVHGIQIQRGPHRGRLVVPADHRQGSAGADKGPCGVQVIYSDDHGKTWKLGATDETYQDGLEANETTVVELNGGRLYFNTRDQNGPAPGTRGGAYSNDGGMTFEPSGDKNYPWFKPQSEVLDPPVVQCSLLRAASTSDGDPRNVILFCGPDENGPTGKGRSDLRIRYSTDETETWHDGLLVHPGPAAYSDMVRIDPKQDQFGILYEAGSLPEKAYTRIDFVVNSLAELLGE